jgi:hypothetical protein
MALSSRAMTIVGASDDIAHDVSAPRAASWTAGK